MPTPQTKTVIELREEYARAPLSSRLPPAVVAAGIGISILTLQTWRSLGRGPAFNKVARRITYTKKVVEAFMVEGARA